MILKKDNRKLFIFSKYIIIKIVTVSAETQRKLSPHLVPRRQTEKSDEQWVKVLPAIGVYQIHLKEAIVKRLDMHSFRWILSNSNDSPVVI